MGPLDLESSDCLQLKPLAGGQEVKRGPGAEHLISACSCSAAAEGGLVEERQAPAIFPTGRLLLVSSVISPHYYI